MVCQSNVLYLTIPPWDCMYVCPLHTRDDRELATTLTTTGCVHH